MKSLQVTHLDSLIRGANKRFKQKSNFGKYVILSKRAISYRYRIACEYARDNWGIPFDIDNYVTIRDLSRRCSVASESHNGNSSSSS